MTNPHKTRTDTPELDKFLSSTKERKLLPIERRLFIKDLFALDTGPEPDPTRPDPEHLPLRIMVMYRIVRTTAQIIGLCAEDETLDDATDALAHDAWVEPTAPIITPLVGLALRKGRASTLTKIHAKAGGLPLLPPRTDPDALASWCRAATIVARDLGVERSREGLLGLEGLLIPETAAFNDVCAQEVMDFETMLLSSGLDLLLDNGERAALKHFREKYGFALKEAKMLMRLVRAQAMDRGGASIEEKRALAEARYEDLIGRAKDAMDQDGELKAMKELARIQGLTRTEPENQSQEFFEVVARVSGSQDKKKLDPRTLALISGHRAEEVEPITIEAEPVPQLEAEDDPLDEAALAEFDKENR